MKHRYKVETINKVWRKTFWNKKFGKIHFGKVQGFGKKVERNRCTRAVRFK